MAETRVKGRRLWKVFFSIGLIGLILITYPSFVLIYTWTHVAHSDFDGGRNGPLDAYRHTLASAIVSYTLDASVVDCVSALMESGGRDSNAMDIHNNRIGASIGANAKSFSEIEPSVKAYILNGEENTSDNEQITWLPAERWSRSLFW